ncbi:MAG TPA: protein-glutamate O-methyltransferase CheR [Gemmatimonadales bacterium]|nr:protein-glutamate O-methyltransferase CheR [Gemmatimonadales bacterium]
MTADDAAFALLARQISRTSGFTLEAYKDKCIRRRIAVRMRACGVHSYDDYRALLDRLPGEYEHLRDALTINVTRFYRNAETWNLIRREVLPAIFDGTRVEVRAWSAGCASGEEPYTLAALAASYLDEVGRREELARLTIDATDIDRTSLERARAACYRPEALGELPGAVSDAYFDTLGQEQRVIDRVRRRVHVRALDLNREPPIRHDYDLILCRNVVIYFDRATQERLFQTFADALAPGGYLVLGKVETLFGAARDRLSLVDARERIYRRPR